MSESWSEYEARTNWLQMYTVPESTVEKEDNTESNESNPSSQTVNVSHTFFGL